MGLKMKNVNIMGVHQFLGKDIYSTIYMGNKGGLDNFQGAKKGRRVFLRGVDTSMHTMT